MNLMDKMRGAQQNLNDIQNTISKNSLADPESAEEAIAQSQIEFLKSSQNF